MGEDLGVAQEDEMFAVRWCSVLGNTEIDLEGASEMASDRKHWREMIRHKREFIGTGHSNDWEVIIKYK